MKSQQHMHSLHNGRVHNTNNTEECKSSQLHSLKHTMEQGSSMRTLLNQVYQVRVDRSPSPTRPSSASSASSSPWTPSPRGTATPPPSSSRTPSPTRAAWTPSPPLVSRASPTLVTRTPSLTRTTAAQKLTPTTRQGGQNRPSTPSSHLTHSTQHTTTHSSGLTPAARPPSRSGLHHTSLSRKTCGNQATPTAPSRPSSANSTYHTPLSQAAKKITKNPMHHPPSSVHGSHPGHSQTSEELDNLYFHVGEDGDIIYRLQYLERENKKLTQLLKKGIQARMLAKERESQLREEMANGKTREKSYISEIETMHTDKKRMIRHIATLEDQIARLENEKTQPSYSSYEDTLPQLDLSPASTRGLHRESSRDSQKNSENDREKDRDKLVESNLVSPQPHPRSLSLVITPQPPSWAAALTTPHSPPYVLHPPPNFNYTAPLSPAVEMPTPNSPQNGTQLVHSLSQLSVGEKMLLDCFIELTAQELNQITDYASANRTYDALLATTHPTPIPSKPDAKLANAKGNSTSNSERVLRKGKDKKKKRLGGLVGFSKTGRRQEAT